MAPSPANSNHAKETAHDLLDPLAVLTDRGVGYRLAANRHAAPSMKFGSSGFLGD